jgi:FolB domain-containing protein
MAAENLDRIHIRDLHTRCIVGIFPEERREKQDVIINICLYGDLREAGRTDRIEDTIDYKGLKKDVLRLVEASQFQLIEALADAIAAACLEHPKVDEVGVIVDKPGALRFARSVAVEIRRSRRD